MMKKFIYTLLSFGPVLALAQDAPQLTNLTGLTDNLLTLVNKIIPFMFALAIVYFFWGLIEYVRASGDPKGTYDGKKHMLWGIVALAVMASVYGLINWLQGAFNITNNSTTPTLPQVR